MKGDNVRKGRKRTEGRMEGRNEAAADQYSDPQSASRQGGILLMSALWFFFSASHTYNIYTISAWAQ